MPSSASYMNDALLLDTCCLLWIMGGERLRDNSLQAIESTASRGAVFVSPISAWEIGILHAKNRFVLRTEVED